MKMGQKIFSVLVFLVVIKSLGQSIGQDVDGFSTIVIPSAVLNLDLANEVASFSYTGYLGENKDFLLGGELKGKSKNGLSSIFNESELVATSEVSGIFGYYFLETTNVDSKDQSVKDKIKSEKNRVDIQADACRNKIMELHEQLILVGLMDENEKNNSFLELFSKKIPDIKTQQNKIYNLKSELENDSSTEKSRKLFLLSEVYGLISQYILFRTQLNQLNNKINESPLSVVTKGSFVYTRWGANGIGYRQDLNNGSSILKERIPKETFNGWRGEIGYNYRWNTNFIGFSVAANYMNNISDLSENTFDLVVEDDSIEPGFLRSTTTVEAFDASEVDEFHRYDLNADFAHVFQLKPDKALNLSLNPYIRHLMYANSATYNHRTDVGVGLFAFNGSQSKLLGGAFVQLNDTFNINRNPENETTTVDRINFGLVVKVAFSGIDVEKKK
ncbi:hypothetical protein [Flagellimonas sp.]|uniref:hypothetical protein n=1 Tax=Flagellimonas sp. TaxID=2058762 RepID=UPI003B5119F3